MKKLFKDKFATNLILCWLTTFLIEMLFKIVSGFSLFSYSSLRIALSTFILALIITYLSFLSKKRWVKNTIIIFYIVLYTIYAVLQIGFINYLGVYMSFNTSSQFGAVKDYIWDYLASFKLIYFLVCIPLVCWLIIYIFIIRKHDYRKFNVSLSHVLLLVLLVLSCYLYYKTITVPFMQNEFQIKSNKKLFINPDVPTVAVNQFGATVFGILDFKSFIFPVEDEQTTVNYEDQGQAVVVSRKVSPALGEIAKNETDKKWTNLNNYFASQKVTDYNSYTGMFEGKNVIVILLESVNDSMINEDYFPNFTKMYNEGWHWKNSYSPRNSCATGNNEFSALTSLYSIYNTCTSNVYKNNTYFESIFGIFNDNGYRTTSAHDFVDWYYRRHTIHPNMGSGKYYGAQELGMKTASYYGEWPSDIEFFEKMLDIILNEESNKPFMTFLTTVTSHQPYSNSSTYGDLHKDFFHKEGYSNSVSRYFSKLKVVDDALGYLVDTLRARGVLDDTVIVLLADHYPYGLNKSYIKEMIDYDLNDYEIERTPFVIYNTQMQPEEHLEYTFYINALPTIANLVNLKYDPRLYMGTDLLSEDYESRVVFADGSWKNEKVYYNASTSRIKYFDEGEELPAEEIQEINNKIALQIEMSQRAIKSNYFKYLKGKIDEYEAQQIENSLVNNEETTGEATETSEETTETLEENTD